MPAYNCEKYIAQAIDSILSQTYSNFELLIADDCSTDNTKQIIDSFTDQRIKRFHNTTNLGYLKASNLLFKQCRGEYISFQDADDYSDERRLEKLLLYLNENTEVACVGSNVIKIDANGLEFHRTQFPLDHKHIKENFANHKTVFTGSALMIRKEIIDKIGSYNLYFDRIGSEDIYWFSQIITEFKVANVNEALYYYRANPNSVTSTHKDPKALVGHDLIVMMYKRRLLHKEDLIRSGLTKKVDAIVNMLLFFRSNYTNGLKRSIAYIQYCILHPVVVFQNLHLFISKYKAKERIISLI